MAVTKAEFSDAAAAASCDGHALSVDDEVAEEYLALCVAFVGRFPDFRADWYGDFGVVALGAVSPVLLAVVAVLCVEVSAPAELQQRVEGIVGD